MKQRQNPQPWQRQQPADADIAQPTCCRRAVTELSVTLTVPVALEPPAPATRLSRRWQASAERLGMSLNSRDTEEAFCAQGEHPPPTLSGRSGHQHRAHGHTA